MNKSKPLFLLTQWKRMKKGCGEMKGKKSVETRALQGEKEKASTVEVEVDNLMASGYYSPLVR